MFVNGLGAHGYHAVDLTGPPNGNPWRGIAANQGTPESVIVTHLRDCASRWRGLGQAFILIGRDHVWLWSQWADKVVALREQIGPVPRGWKLVVGMGNACGPSVIVYVCLSPAKIESLCGHGRVQFIEYLRCRPYY